MCKGPEVGRHRDLGEETESKCGWSVSVVPGREAGPGRAGLCRSRKGVESLCLLVTMGSS